MPRILFLNLQGANPFEGGETGQAAGRLQTVLDKFAADVVILCEVGNNGLMDAEIESIKIARACEYVAETGFEKPSTLFNVELSRGGKGATVLCTS